MSLTVFLVVLCGAALHASWNAMVKGGRDKLLSAALIMAGAAAISLPFLFVLPLPLPESRPYLAASILLQTAYLSLVALAYEQADMSRAYPLMRGTAPVLVSLFSLAVLGETLGAAAWSGIITICAGILAMVRIGGGQERGMLWALLNAGVIASYTLVDGAGVRASGSAAAYTLWLNTLTAVPVLGLVLWRRGRALGPYLRQNWLGGLLGGFGTTASYGLALWAMTRAPVAVVAALRETSILFGVLISILVLRERPHPSRILGAAIIAGGAMVLRLA